MELTQRLITPTEANKILQNQRINRNVLTSHVKLLANDMTNGRWVSCSEPIKFDTSGLLIDGQHRLHAVIESGESQIFNVLTGFSEESMSVIDIGTPRSAAHIAQISGVNMSQKHSACINSLLLPEKIKSNFSKPRIIEIFNKYSSGIVFACESRGSGLQPTSLLTSLIAKAFYYENRKRLSEFLSMYANGHVIDPEKDSAVVTYRNWVLDLKSKNITFSYKQYQQAFSMKTQSILISYLKNIPVKRISKITDNDLKIFDNYPLPDVSNPSEDNLRRIKKSFNEY